MKKILYVPLDERACNYQYPRELAAFTDDIKILTPPLDWMGFCKTPADCEKIWEWLFLNAPDCDYAILSVDTLVYGNIINSRIHHKTQAECLALAERFVRLKECNPALSIHAFNLVARVAGYNSSHEDPDYWQFYGRDIWHCTCLADKAERGCADAAEIKELAALSAKIPHEYLDDFFARRDVDRAVNLRCVELVKENVFDVLTIPKDDTAEYGFAAMDQKAIAQKVRENRLMGRVLVYPGADEVGCVLFARVFCRIKNYMPRVYLRFSSTFGPSVVPLYEDRPLLESIKSQITSAGGVYVDTPMESDCMLALNTPGTHMIESTAQYTKDITFQSHINMHEFLRYITYYHRTFGKAIGIAEVSVANGCENEFMDYALLSGVLELADSVGGWNTAQNTIGTVLAETIVISYYKEKAVSETRRLAMVERKLHAITADWLFQSNVLHRFLKETEGRIDPYALKDHYGEALDFVKAGLNELLAEKFGGRFDGKTIQLENMRFDWDFVFMLNFDVHLNGN